MTAFMAIAGLTSIGAAGDMAGNQKKADTIYDEARRYHSKH